MPPFLTLCRGRTAQCLAHQSLVPRNSVSSQVPAHDPHRLPYLRQRFAAFHDLHYYWVLFPAHLSDPFFPLVVLGRLLVEPILEFQPRNFLEIAPIGGEKQGVIAHGDAGCLQVHGGDFHARSAEVFEEFRGVRIQ
jgi:hypothetical protein